MGLNHQGSGHFHQERLLERVSLSCYLYRVFVPIKQEERMSEPTIADNKPVKIELDKDKKYYFCMCGLSSNQPFCDGSHKGSDFTPMAFQCNESKDYYLCQCKHSGNKPYCDGSHKQFDDDQVGRSSS
jgi:CDGSH-type Zn-finger protein